MIGSTASTPIVVVGAGIVGITTALVLRLEGFSVLLVDRDDAGRACSFGNAGIIATSFVLPLSAPHNLLALPRMLLSRDAPLTIRPGDFAQTLPWIARVLINARPSAQRRSLAGLKLLNGIALDAWRLLLKRVSAGELLHERGLLEVSRDRSGAASLRRHGERLRGEGICAVELSAAEIQDLEPELGGAVNLGLLHGQVAHVSDPYSLSLRLLEALVKAGGEFRKVAVRSIRVGGGGVTAECEDGHAIAGDHLVVTTGLDAPQLLADLGLQCPIGAEHGYHYHLRHSPIRLSRPVALHRESVVVTPMSTGLRLAGTVELSAIGSTPNHRRSHMLLHQARGYLKNLVEGAGTCWRGSRPSFPDSLPAIGTVTGTRIHYAFGHQHLGLTQAAATANLILDQIRGRPLIPGAGAYSLDRFGSKTGAI